MKDRAAIFYVPVLHPSSSLFVRPVMPYRPPNPKLKGMRHESKRLDSARIQAKRRGMTLNAYLKKVRTEKWCSACKEWHRRDAFGSDLSRLDSKAAICKKSRLKRP